MSYLVFGICLFTWTPTTQTTVVHHAGAVCVYSEDLSELMSSEIGIYGRYDISKPHDVAKQQPTTYKVPDRFPIYKNRLSMIAHTSVIPLDDPDVLDIQERDTYTGYYIRSIYSSKLFGDMNYVYARCINQTDLFACDGLFEVAIKHSGSNQVEWIAHDNIRIINCSDHWSYSGNYNADNHITSSQYRSTVHKYSDQYCKNYIQTNMVLVNQSITTTSNITDRDDGNNNSSVYFEYGYCVSGTNTPFDGFYEFYECRNWIPIYKKLDDEWDSYINTNTVRYSYYLLFDIGLNMIKLVRDIEPQLNQTQKYYNDDTREHYFDATNTSKMMQQLDEKLKNEENNPLAQNKALLYMAKDTLPTFICLTRHANVVLDYYHTDDCVDWVFLDPVTRHVSFYYNITVRQDCSHRVEETAGNNGQESKNEGNEDGGLINKLPKMMIQEIGQMNTIVVVIVVSVPVLVCVLILVVVAYKIGVRNTVAQYNAVTKTEIETFLTNGVNGGDSMDGAVDDSTEDDTDETESPDESADAV